MPGNFPCQFPTASPTVSKCSGQHDLVPTWPIGKGCDVAPGSLIAKAGVSGEQQIPFSPGWSLDDWCSLPRMGVLPQPHYLESRQGTEGQAQVVMGGKPGAGIWHNNPVISRRKSHDIGRLCQWIASEQEPRQVYAHGCPSRGRGPRV